MSSPQKSDLPLGVSILAKLQNLIFLDCAGPRILPMRHCINTFKATTFLWVLFLMWAYETQSRGIMLYLCLHGSYGIAWLVKDLTFPDARFMQKASPGSNILAFLFLCAYWLIPLPLAAGYGVSTPSIPRMVAIILLYLSGLALMLISDHQKTTKLRSRPGLISDGLFTYTRNPNYLGQIMIYSSFALCAGHLAGFLVVHGLACTVFALNIYLKDKLSYETKKGWEDYRKKSYILLPKIFPTMPLNLVFYGVLAIVLYSFFSAESTEMFKDFGFIRLGKMQ